jgi:hypothetical protein
MNIERLNFWDWVITKGCATGHRIRNKLSINESNFKGKVAYGHDSCRDYFIYRALDEVQKAATKLIQWKDFFSSNGELQKHEAAEQMFRVTLQGVYDEINLRVRKLTELIAEIILFSYTNEEVYYKDYLYFSEMIRYLNDQSDREEFYAYRSSNADDYIAELRLMIKGLEKDIDPLKRWYLKKPLPIDKIERPRLSGFSDKYRLVLSHKKADEITLLGKSYRHAYGESTYVHFSHDEHSCVFNENACLLEVDKVCILVINILKKLKDLLGGAWEAEDSDLKNLSDEVGQKAYFEWTTSKATPGDYVAIGQDLGVVLEVNKSKYGFLSYKIKYLSEPPLPYILEDSFAVFEIFRLGNRVELNNMIRECFKKVGTDIEMSKIESLDNSFFEKTLVKCFKKTYEDFRKFDASNI